MAHNITIRADGTAEFFSLRESAWHKLGRVLPEEITDGKVLEAAGLDWNVDEVAVGTIERVRLADDTMTNAQEVKGYKALRRSDNGDVLSIVGKDYRTFQNAELVDLMRRIAGLGHITWETAGSLNGGRTVWALARLPDLSFNVGPKLDPTNAYMLATTGHGNQKALTLMPTTVRVVCANTMAMATGGSAENAGRRMNADGLDFTEGALAKGYAITHTRGLDKALAQVAKAYANMAELSRITAAKANALAAVTATPADVEAYWSMVLRLAVPAGADEKARALAIRNREASLAALRSIHASATCQVDGTAGTWYAAAQAVLELVDHRPDRAEDKRTTLAGRTAGATWGEGAATKADAWACALAMAAAA